MLKSGGTFKLYESEDYRVDYSEQSSLVRLSFLKKRLMLSFIYDKWQELRSIVAGIELSGKPQHLNHIELYADEDNVFSESDDTIVWLTLNRMVGVHFYITEWKEFKTMMESPGIPVPCDSLLPWIMN